MVELFESRRRFAAEFGIAGAEHRRAAGFTELASDLEADTLVGSGDEGEFLVLCAGILVLFLFRLHLKSFDEGVFSFAIRIMAMNTLTALEPRKTPVQARAAVTVEAISEATVQVLLSHGADRLTTTRVAARAGVSVGTLYQYYPNKESLLFAVMEAHFEQVAGAVEAACQQASNKALAEMIKQVVEVYVDAKMERADISVALYQVSAKVGGTALVRKAVQRMRKAVEAMLQTASDIDLPPDRFAIDMMLAAMSGAMRWLFEVRPSPMTIRRQRDQLVLLCQSYMAASTARRA